MVYTKIEKQIIKEFVKAINPKLKVSFKEHDFQANVYNKTIFVGTRVADTFMNWFRKEFPQCETMNWWLIHLLHEIGHCETDTKKSQSERTLMVASLELDFFLLDNPTKEDYKKYNEDYFVIPNEYSATTWGVNYYLTHQEALDGLVEMLGF